MPQHALSMGSRLRGYVWNAGRYVVQNVMAIVIAVCKREGEDIYRYTIYSFPLSSIYSPM
jgi:hypothetical protein